jgi:hypothetical protein
VLACAAVSAAAVLSLPAVGLGAGTPRCTAGGLRLDSVRVLGALGARDWDLSLRNVGSRTCHLFGYPGVALLDGHARVMNVSTMRKAAAKHTVVLAPWKRAFFTVHYESNGPCASGVFPTGIQIIPPGATRGLRLFHRFGMCAGTHPAVTPVRALLG